MSVQVFIWSSGNRSAESWLIQRLRPKLTAYLRRSLALLVFVASVLFGLSLRAATVPAGFSETIIAGPNAGLWNGAVGVTFESNGRMYVWEGAGRVYFKDPADPSFTLLLDISEEVGFWSDHGMVGFALDPDFRVNGYLYVLYVVDRHHLMNFGTGSYNPNTSYSFSATIGRLTRYTANAAGGFRSVNTASRFILVGETRQTGIPICSETHGVGTLVFSEDGTLLVSTGDGASPNTADTGGAAFGSYAPQALTDGIIRPKENIGAFRSQLVDCLNGKVLRLDPATGHGVPSNPFFDPASPRSAKSRVWALGLRNPFRMSLRPESGSHTASDGQPGVLYVGNVGWDLWECLKVVTGPGQNFGWPIYEGLSVMALYDSDTLNPDAPNPLYPAGGCNQYFSFKELLHEDTLNAAGFPPFDNPCNSAVKIPAAIPQFLHTRPVLDWNHSSAITRTPTFTSGNATIANVGAGGSPVSGSQFQGNCAIGGAWYTATAFPTQYQNTYFFADWGQGVIKNMTFDANDKPSSLGSFASAAGSVVCFAPHPTDGSLYYVSYSWGDAGTVRKLAFTGNRTPVAVASLNTNFGVTPLAVQFSSAGSSDPDGNPITYSWNFGDGSALSTVASPAHTFTAPAGVPTKFTVSLTVRDPGNLTATTNLVVSANNTPPIVAITSPANGDQYSPTTPTTINLAATVTDAQSGDGQLSYLWQALLHHNDHDHFVTTSTNHTGATMVLSPIGCDGLNTYYYRLILIVTDPAGLSATREVQVHPNCAITNLPPVLSDLGNQSVLQDRSTVALPFTVGDLETPASSLQLLGNSSNPGLVPSGNIVFDGSGSNRTVTVTPALGQVGSATITVTVSDGELITSDAFVLTVSLPVTATSLFTNANAITIPSAGAATPYPSTINVAGMSGTIWNLSLSLRNLTHQWTPDLDLLLVGPTGQGIIICSDAGNGPVNNITVTVTDAAAGALPNGNPMTSGTFKPTNIGAGDTFPGPAPGGAYVGALSNYFGLAPNGAWSLYVFDDGAGDLGSLAGGWSLSLTTLLGSGGSQPPTMSDIANQSTPVSTPTAAIPFTIGDAETPASNLTLNRSSSNPTLVPTNNIVFGGSGSNRTVMLTPASGQTGTSSITVTVSDATNSTSDSFVLTVTAVNTPPTMTALPDQSVSEDQTAAALNFTIGDGETAAASLVLGKASSNTALVPTNNIVFGGSGSNRTATMTPVVNVSGVATITLSVNDGQLTASRSFLLTVNAVNDAPTISGISNQTIAVGAATGPLGFVVGDVESPAASLILSADSSDPALVPTNNIVFGGSGSNHTVAVTAAAGLSGSSIISLLVSDGTNTTSTNFTVTVSSLTTGTFSFSNATAITIPVTGAASPYPSTIHTSGLGGTASNVVVTLRNLTHTWTRDLDMLLVGPGGQKMLLSSDAGNGAANNVTLTFSNGAAVALPRSSLVTGAYRPANYDSATDVFPAPAPAAPFGASLTAFNGQTPNGTWALFVFDDGNGDSGNIAGGWSLTLTAGTSGVANQPPTISDVLNQSTTINTPTADLPFTVGDFETPATNLTLIAGSSNSSLLPTNNILFNGGGSNRTVTVTPAGGLTGTVTVTVTVRDGTNSASDTFVLTVNAVNTPPTITSLTGQVISEDTVAGPLSFNIGDSETGAASLTLARTSSNPVLIPTNSIIFGGSGSNRTVTVTPTANLSGTATLTLSVSDGQVSVNTAFLVTVNAVNDAPTISGVANQSIPAGGTAGPLGFVIGDVETPAANLAVSAGSSNPALVPANNIVLGGSGSNRTVMVTALTNQTGSATVSLVVGDGTNSSATSFTVTASALTSGTRSFTNPTAIVIPDSGPATPYPSIINVANFGGTVTNVTLTLRNLSHTWTRDIDMLLVGPGGQKALVSSDAGNGGANNATYTLSDAAASALPLVQLVSGTYRPADYETGDVLAAPAPSGPYTAPLSAFQGQPANGPWSLYVFDDGGGDLGSLAGGWSLTVTTVAGAGDVTNSPTLARLSIALGTDKSPVVLRLEDASSQTYLIETSDDLNSWTTLGLVQLVNGTGSFADDDADLDTGRFYRARVAP